jgi:hypothetical protein
LAGVTGLAVAGAAVLTMSPAHASASTVDAQLSVSGVATKANVLGGTTVGIHPGDTVDFKASALPTAGLENVPALGSLLGGILGSLTGSNFQVVVTFDGNFPSVGGQTITLGGPTSGACKGKTDVPVTFPASGTYNFTWKVQYVLTGLLGCSQKSLGSTTLNQLADAGVALNASNQWIGKIVAAQDPPKGGISIQLPGISASPSIKGAPPLPGVTVPGVSLPTVTVTLPDLGGLIPGGGGKTSGSGHSSAPSSGTNYTPPGLTIPEQVVPKGYGNGAGTVGAAGGGFGNALPDLGGALVNGAPDSGAGAAAPSGSSSPAAANVSSNAADLAASPTPSPQLPVLLAILAIIALSLVTATYARLYLLRRN